MKKAYLLIGIVLFLLLTGCKTSYQIKYPSSDDLFMTLGDDPGTESEVPYSPKGLYYYSYTEQYLPIPILGLIPLGNAEIDRVIYEDVLPEIREMGGDSLTSGKITHTPRPHWALRFLGLGILFPSQTVVTGQVNKR